MRQAASTLLACAIAWPLGAISDAEPGQPCQVVAGQKLEVFYPALPREWQRGDPASETDTRDNVSRTTVDFDRGVETISVEIMDSCRDADVLLLIREVLKQFPPGTPGTAQRHTTVNNFPAYEEFTESSGHGEIHVLVADRFMIKVTAGTSTLSTLRTATGLIPMDKLAALK